MLRVRVLTAVALLAVVLTALFTLPSTAFALVALAILVVPGSWEISALAGLSRPGIRAGWLVISTAGALALWWVAGEQLLWLFAATAVLWLLALPWLARPSLWSEAHAPTIAIKLVVLTFVLISGWLAVIWLHGNSPWAVILLLVLIAAADIGAYFTGRHFGGTKLAPRISPGKTRSGAVGGLVATLILTPLAAALFPHSPLSPAVIAAAAVPIALLSIGGDLFVSLLKRQRGLKDTSAILPGHGGILDRTDSLLAALPFFTLVVMFFGQ